MDSDSDTPTTPRSSGALTAADLQEDVLLSLRRILQATYLYSKKLQRSHGLTAPQLVVLHRLSPGHELSGNDLARAVCLSPPTMAGILARLEDRGLISRRRSDKDRRRLLVSLTAEGDTLLRDAPPPLQERLSQNLSRLEDRELLQIVATLRRIVALMGAESVDAGPLLSPDSDIRDVNGSGFESH